LQIDNYKGKRIYAFKQLKCADEKTGFGGPSMKENKSISENELNEEESEIESEEPEEDLIELTDEEFDPEASIEKVQEFMERLSGLDEIKTQLTYLMKHICGNANVSVDMDDGLAELKEKEELIMEKERNLELLKESIMKQKEDLNKIMVKALNLDPIDEEEGEVDIPDSLEELKAELEEESKKLRKKARRLKKKEEELKIKEEELREKENDLVEAANPIGYINKRYRRTLDELQDEREKLMNREVRVKEIEEESRRREDELHTFEDHLNKREKLIKKRENRIRKKNRTMDEE
jgi:DNA repair exonuclease SbcCD ATPase subunit